MKGFKTFMGSHEGVDPKHIPEWQRPKIERGKGMVTACSKCSQTIGQEFGPNVYSDKEGYLYCDSCWFTEGNEICVGSDTILDMIFDRYDGYVEFLNFARDFLKCTIEYDEENCNYKLQKRG